MTKVCKVLFSLVLLASSCVSAQFVSELIPEGFPVDGLEQISETEFSSPLFGEFTVDPSSGVIEHSVLGELVWDYNPENGLVTLDSADWGLLETSFDPESEAGYSFPSVYSVYFDSRYDVDFNGSFDSGLFYSYELNDNGQEVGWTNHIGIDPMDTEGWLAMVQANYNLLELLKASIDEAYSEMSELRVEVGSSRPEELHDLVAAKFSAIEPAYEELMYAYYRIHDSWNDLHFQEGDTLRVQRLRSQVDEAYGYAATAYSVAVEAQKVALSDFEQVYNVHVHERSANEMNMGFEIEREARESPEPFSYVRNDATEDLGVIEPDWSMITVLGSNLDLSALSVEARITSINTFEGAFLSSDRELHVVFNSTLTENWTSETDSSVEPELDENGNVILNEGLCWLFVPKKEIDGRKATGYYAFPFALFNGLEQCVVSGASLIGQTPLPNSWRPNEYSDYGFMITSNNEGRSNIVAGRFKDFEGSMPPWKLHFSDTTASSSGEVDPTKDAIDWDVVEVVERGIDDIRDYKIDGSITKWRIHVGNYFRPWYGWYVEIEVDGTDDWQTFVPFPWGGPVAGNMWIFVPKASGGYYAAPFEGYLYRGNPMIFALANLNFETVYDVFREELAFPWVPSPSVEYGWMLATNAGAWPGGRNGDLRTNIVMQSFPNEFWDVGETAEYTDYEYEGVDCIPSDEAFNGSPELSAASCELVLEDSLQGNTVGTVVGGSFGADGYVPSVGENHILYEVDTVKEGFVEFEVKGMSNSSYPFGTDSGFFCMYDGRGMSEPITYSDYKENYFRWNLHYRQNRCAIKCVITTATDSDARRNASVAKFDGPRDWTDEPTGNVVAWDSGRWYKFRVEWVNKKFSVYLNNSLMWQTDGPNDYEPVIHRMRLGSGPGKYGSEVSGLTYRNFKVYRKNPASGI